MTAPSDDEARATTTIIQRATVVDYRYVVRCPACRAFYDARDPGALVLHTHPSGAPG